MVSAHHDQVQAVRRVLDEAFADKKFLNDREKAKHAADMDDLADRVAYFMASAPDPYDPSYGLIRLARHLRLDKVPDSYHAAIAALWRDNPLISAKIAAGKSVTQALEFWLSGSWGKNIKNFHERTEMGLAARLLDRFGADLARSPELGFFGWKNGRWVNAEEKNVLDSPIKEMVRRLDHETEMAGVHAEIEFQMRAQATAEAQAKAEGRELSDEEKAKFQDLRLPDEEMTKATNAAHKFAMTAQSSKVIAAVRSLAVSEAGFTVDADVWDADPAILTCPNITIELKKEVGLRSPRRTDRSSKTTAVQYTPVPGNRWETFLEQALPDPDVRRYFQKLAGYSLYGANPKRLMVFLIGPTSTGKSTMLAVIGKVLGDYAGAFEMSMFRGKEQEAPRPDLIEAMPKRFLYASETSDRWVLHADEVKRALGGADLMRARKMRTDQYLVRQPAFTPFVATNNAPTIKGADKALWRRLTVVPFTQEEISREAERDELARELADAEGPAILMWLVEGWRAYQAEGLADVPHACVQATMDLTNSLEPLDVWLAEATEADPEAVTTMDDLWTAYLAWCDTGNVADKGSKIAMGKALAGRGYVHTKVGPKDKRVHARRGLRLVAVSAEI